MTSPRGFDGLFLLLPPNLSVFENRTPNGHIGRPPNLARAVKKLQKEIHTRQMSATRQAIRRLQRRGPSLWGEDTDLCPRVLHGGKSTYRKGLEVMKMQQMLVIDVQKLGGHRALLDRT